MIPSLVERHVFLNLRSINNEAAKKTTTKNNSKQNNNTNQKPLPE